MISLMERENDTLLGGSKMDVIVSGRKKNIIVKEREKDINVVGREKSQWKLPEWPENRSGWPGGEDLAS